VHKETVVACVRHMVDGTVKREVRTFDTTTTDLLALADWLGDLVAHGLIRSSFGRWACCVCFATRNVIYA
jgi:hypothetical protein